MWNTWLKLVETSTIFFSVQVQSTLKLNNPRKLLESKLYWLASFVRVYLTIFYKLTINAFFANFWDQNFWYNESKVDFLFLIRIFNRYSTVTSPLLHRYATVNDTVTPPLPWRDVNVNVKIIKFFLF